jgi:hypothetical protein
MKVDRQCLKCGAPFRCPENAKKRFCSHECSMSVNRSHGLTFTTEHAIWRQMKQRCYNPRKSDYPQYGAKGIRICDRWLNSFENFYADMGPRPSMNHTVDRIDGTKDYSPENCRWATKAEQSRNRPGYTYSQEEDAKIREAIALKMNFTQMAAYVGKSRGSVSARAYRLGLKSGVPPIPKKDRTAQPGLSLPSPHGNCRQV